MNLRTTRVALVVSAAAILCGFQVHAALPLWPQTASDLPPDPGVRFGTLPNGLRYAVMRNATPGRATSLRLRIGSGSLEETDDEQGLAHVLEHMAFKGSAHVPGNEMIRILQRLGLAFGPDTNARTGWTETVYELDLPRSDQASVNTGLMLLRETGSDLTLDPQALDSERGVILSEERLRDTPGYRAEKAQIDLFLSGQRATKRFPIGQVDVIRSAPASRVRAYYEANYRPDNAQVIAVGDFDPGEMETAIKARFSDWKKPASPLERPDLGAVERRGLTVKLVPLPGGASQVVIAWAHPYDAAPDTLTKEKRETVENLGLAVLNRRLARLSRSDAPPFLGAQAGFQNLLHSGKIATLEATAAPNGWRAALTAADEEIRRVVADGVSAAELAREEADMRATLKANAEGASTRLTPTLANDIVTTIDDDEVFTSPAQDLATFDAAVKGLTPEAVNTALRGVFAGSGPLAELVTPEAIKGGEPAVLAAFNEASKTPLAKRASVAAVAWPYESFGSPGAVVSRDAVSDLGLVTARFANGVALTVKPTKLRADQVLVSVRVGGGRLDMPRDKSSPGWAAGAVVPGGFGKISFEDARAALAGKVHSAALAVDDTAFQFAGATRPEDVDTQLQVLAAYLADPGLRGEAFERLRTAYLAELPQLDATPSGVLAREQGGLFTSGDPRFAFPSRDALAHATAAEWRELFRKPLTQGPVEITIVGDIDPDKAIAEVARTFGALPAREPLANVARADLRVRFPAAPPAPVRFSDTGREDQAVAVVAWPETDFYADMRRSRADMLAGEVFENRLLDQVRIAEGATYSPETQVDLSQSIPGYGFALAEVEMPPARIPGFFDTAAKIARDMAEHGVTQDELTRARAPRVAGLAKAQLTNEYWIADLSGSIADPRRLDLIRSTFPDYAAVTPADIQASARRWLVDARAFKVVVSAAPQAATAEADTGAKAR